MQLVLTPELILDAYRLGMFPMAYSGDTPYVHWVCPEDRGQLSITDIHIPRKLKKTIRQEHFEITINHDFEQVIRTCAEIIDDRPETWINEPIIKTFCTLHEQGHAHSIEAWYEGELAGGIYGLAIGSAFFGESMVSRVTDASKVCLIHLCARLWKGGFTLFDTQFVNDHLKQFGVYEVPHEQYKEQLDKAIKAEADFILDGVEEQTLISGYLTMRDAQS